MNDLKLKIELVPYDCFEQNLRHLLSKSDWDKIRKYTYKKYNYRCCICGVSGVVLSAHETWDYKIMKNKKGKQKLVDIVSLCNDCHMIKHIEFANILAGQGKLDMRNLLNHFCKVNECELDTFVKHYNDEVDKWNERHDISFSIDIKYLEKLKLDLDSYPIKK